MTRRAEAIERFINYFHSHIDSIEAVASPTYRKTLYATALDTLARAAFGKISNRVRMIRLINELTSWQAKDLVSLPQAALNLRQKKRGHDRLYREINRRLALWPSGHIIKIDDSPKIDEFNPIATKQEKKLLAKCKYAELFYTYRNNLIHEFREPGYGIEMPSDKKPYYTSMINQPWQLVFPVGFFTELYRGALDGLKNYLTTNKIDPYTKFEFGSLWRGR